VIATSSIPSLQTDRAFTAASNQPQLRWLESRDADLGRWTCFGGLGAWLARRSRDLKAHAIVDIVVSEPFAREHRLI
jgi:hypothetical protein